MKIEEVYQLYLNSTGICTDTRKLESGNLFFALKGENFNGNKFAEQAVENGAIAALVDEPEFENQQKQIFLVENGLQTLQELARYHRKEMDIPFIALTGSNGKTTTKELIAACLEQKFKVAFTQGNLNNHIGVPLTLLSVDHRHEIAVIEMGANHKNEIAELCEIALPDYGYITNFGKAHLEGFGGVEGVIEAKSELYAHLEENGKSVFVNADDNIQMERTAGIKRITFGLDKNADYTFQRASKDGLAAVFYDDHLLSSNLSGAYNEVNIAAAATIAMHFGVDIHQSQEAVKNYFPKINRSQEISHGKFKIIMDAYNANPSSMDASLRNFDALQGRKTVILGDMFELGDLSQQEHHDVAKLATTLDFDRIFLIGKEFMHVKLVHPCLFQFPNKEVFAEFLKDEPITTERILIKGSRGMALESLLEMV